MTRPSRTRDAILATLAAVGHMTATELAEHLGLTRGAVVHCIGRVRGQKLRVLRIVSWQRQERSHGDMSPVYGLGRGPDAPKPPALTPTERTARYLRRHAALEKAKRQHREGRPVPTWLQGLL